VISNEAVEKLAALAGLSMATAAHHDWPAIERSLGGILLPSDYKLVVDTVPDGKFKELVKVVRPASDQEYLGFYATQLEDMRGFRAGGWGEFPYPIFPEEGGLLPWGFGPRGELFFWLTQDDDPDRWPVLWADTYYNDWFRYDLPMSEFLLRLVEDPPPEVGEIAFTDLGISAPFRAFAAPVTAGKYLAEPMVSGWIPQSPPEVALAETLDAMHAAVPTRLNEIAALLDALPQKSTSERFTDWPALEDRLGTAFPADYKTFYETLGPGVLCDLNILGPESSGPFSMTQMLDGLRALIAKAGMSMIVTAFPEPRGVLPWGYAPDGRIYCWRVAGTDPESWCVALVSPNFTVVDHLDLSFSSFLVKYSGVRDQTGLSEYDFEKWVGGPAFVAVGTH
jgi:hypothetical protein